MKYLWHKDMKRAAIVMLPLSVHQFIFTLVLLLGWLHQRLLSKKKLANCQSAVEADSAIISMPEPTLQLPSSSVVRIMHLCQTPDPLLPLVNRILASSTSLHQRIPTYRWERQYYMGIDQYNTIRQKQISP